MHELNSFSSVVDSPDEIDRLTEDEKHRINVCRKIRKAAISRDLHVDTTEHAVSYSRHLFSFIESCGFTLRQFVVHNLQDLQPYDIVELKDQCYNKHIVCVTQLNYVVPVYVKMDITQFGEVVVSFHENQVRRSQSLRRQSLPQYSVMFAKHLRDDGAVVCTIPRGFLNIDVTVRGFVFGDVVKCLTCDVSTILTSRYNRRLQEVALDGVHGTFSSEREVSITSYGESVLSQVSLMIDYVNTRELAFERQEGFDALGFLLMRMRELPDYAEKLLALKERYRNNELVLQLLEVADGE